MNLSRPLAAVALALPAISLAGPSDYVTVPGVDYGEREIDVKYGTARLGSGEGRLSEGSLGLGWGATPWWFTEVYAKFRKESFDRTRYDAFEWENKFQLTETGKYFVDVGFLTEIEVPREHREEGYELKVGPLFQWETGALQWNANLFFERVLRGRPEPGEPRVTELGYQLQVKYRARPEFEYGLQAFGEMGDWKHWEPASEQKHVAGPAIFGKFKVGEREAIKYNAGWLFGVSKAAPDNTLRFQMEYEF